MDHQLAQLIHDTFEFNFFLLIMVGLCTTVLCSTILIAAGKISKAFNNLAEAMRSDIPGFVDWPQPTSTIRPLPQIPFISPEVRI